MSESPQLAPDVAAERYQLVSRAPLLPITVGLMLGIAVDAEQPLGGTFLWCLLLGSMLGVTLALPSRRGRQWLLFLVMIPLGALLHDAHYRRLPANHIARFTTTQPYFTTITGVIVQQPVQQRLNRAVMNEHQQIPQRTRFVLATESIEGTKVQQATEGLLLVTIKEPLYDLYAGQRVRIFGELYQPVEPANPGQLNWARYLRLQGIRAALTCHYPEALEKLPAGGSSDWRAWLNRWRMESQTLLLDEVLPDELDKRSLLNALVLGQRSQLDRDLEDAFRKTGTSHFLALSGMNVGMLAWFLYLIGRLLGWSRRGKMLWIMAGLLLFATLIEPTASVIRATLIGMILCSSALLHRPPHTINSIALAALLMLLYNPLQLFDVGFQLSFLVVIGLILLVPMFDAALQTPIPLPISTPPVTPSSKHPWARDLLRRLRRLIVDLVWGSLSVSLVAWLVGTPLAAYHFNTLHSFGWPTTTLLMPLVFLISIGGYLKLLVGALWPSSTILIAPLVSWPTSALVWLVEQLAQLPGSAVEVPTPARWWLLLYYLSLGLAIRWWLLRRQRRGPMFWFWPLLTGTITLAAALVTLIPGGLRQQLRATVLSVGNGLAVVLELPDGQNVLYDLGTTGDFDVTNSSLLPLLRQYNIRHIDAVVLSHGNFNHYSGLPALWQRLPISKVIVSPYFNHGATPTSSLGRFWEQLQQTGIPMVIATTHKLSESHPLEALSAAHAEILWPTQELPSDTLNNANDASLVVRLSYAGYRLLLPGDIGPEAQRELVNSGIDLHADVLLLPQSGNPKQLIPDFIRAVQPHYLIRSGGSPTAKGVDQFEADYQVQLFDTARDGAVTVIFSNHLIRVEAFHDQQRSRFATPP
ncbi:MAG: ComE operon protein 3 [Phycisphaerae bacterium]|nr:ComE operon protein 3 [Phycisphaerae bacterium]